MMKRNNYLIIMNRILEAHTVKYSPNNSKRELELVKAFNYMVEHIDKFVFSPREGNLKFRKEYNISEQDEILFLKTLVYDDKNFTDKEVLLDEDLDIHDQYIDGNELYVFIIKDVNIQNYQGLIYLKFSLHNKIISFHDTKYPTIKKDYNYIKESELTEKQIFVSFNKVNKNEINYVKYKGYEFKVWYDFYGPRWCCDGLNIEFAVTYCNSIKEVKESIDWELDILNSVKNITDKKEEYFVDFYKDKYGEYEVHVEAMWDKNGKELYNGAKAIYHANWGDEIGKIKIYQDVTSDNKYVYSYGFKPKKGSALFIYDNNDVELI